MLLLASCGGKTTGNEDKESTDSIVLVDRTGKSFYGQFTKDSVMMTPLKTCVTKWLGKELNMRNFDGTASLDNRFFEITLSGMSQKIDNHLDNPMALYYLLQEAKAKTKDGKWYSCKARALAEMDEGLNASTDPATMSSYFDTYITMPEDDDWVTISSTKREKLTLSLSDGSTIAVEEPLLWSVDCQYATARVMSSIPEFTTDFSRVYFVSDVVLVRNFDFALRDYSLYGTNDQNLEVRPYFNIEHSGISRDNGIYVLAKIYAPHKTTF